MSTLNSLINDPAYHDYLAILKGARNGLVYGVKIRFPHALIMSILFSRGPWKARFRKILSMTAEHAIGLAKFVSLYKTLLLVMRRMNGGKQRDADTFLAGLIGGYFVFGDRTPINEQIVLYVTSRVVATILTRDPAGAKPLPPIPGGPARPLPPNARQFAAFAALAWGAVMYVFQHHAEGIQPGMWSSMVYLYRDSDRWDGLRTLLWKNKG